MSAFRPLSAQFVFFAMPYKKLQVGGRKTMQSTLEPCRAVTREEVAHYNTHGWAMLRGFVKPDTVKAILRNALQAMGADADSNPEFGELPGGGDHYVAYFNAEYANGLSNPDLRPYIEGCARAAKELMSRRRPVAARYFNDFYAPKLPSSQPSKHAGNGPTAFHQDYVAFGIDRTGGMSFWLALEDYTPEFGTMSFVSGSHREGVLGDYRTYPPGEDLLDVFPEIREEHELTEPMVYAAGDVTVHSHLLAHGAGANLTNRPRWAYIVSIEPADVHWTGGASVVIDSSGMTLNQLLPDDRYPILA
jgi:hypothetical protein